MKIRTKITLWIIGAGICASLALSSIVFFELVDQYYQVIDADLDARLNDLEELRAGAEDLDSFIYALETYSGTRHYWGRIYSSDKRILWQTPVAETVEIPIPGTSEPSTFHTDILPSRVYPDMDDEDRLAFRIRSVTIQIQGEACTLLVGKPIEDPDAEILELAGTIAIGLGASTVILLGLSYFFAGRVLKPITDISRLAEKINDKTLALRIPVGKSQDEFSRLAKTLNAMFDRLQFSFARQKQFLSDASHELRSPITLLRLQTEERLQSKDLPCEYKTQLIRQHEALHRMSRLINTMLDLSALELGRNLNIGETVFADLVRSVLDDFSDIIAAMEITTRVRIAPGLRIRCDVEKIRRAIVNLVDNAIKYNREGGTSGFDCRCCGTTGAFFRLQYRCRNS